MTLNGVFTMIVRYFTEFGSFRGALCTVVEGVVVKSTRSLSHLLISLLLKVVLQIRAPGTEAKSRGNAPAGGGDLESLSPKS